MRHNARALGFDHVDTTFELQALAMSGTLLSLLATRGWAAMTALPPSVGGVTPPPVLTHPADLRVTALLLSVHRSAAESERGWAPFVPSEHVHPLHRTPRLNGARSDFTTHGVRARI